VGSACIHIAYSLKRNKKRIFQGEYEEKRRLKPPLLL
jgi:hypothetical protein